MQNDQSCTTSIELWPGARIDVDLKALRRAAVPVKGVCCDDPLRFLEIFGNEGQRNSVGAASAQLPSISREDIERLFFPAIPGIAVHLGEDMWQPPFTWRDATPQHICVSFTYNTNAIYRILCLIRDRGCIRAEEVSNFLDSACRLLTQLYRADGGFLLRNINNNFNMYLISKVVEFLVGKHRYDAELQELDSTTTALATALELARGHLDLNTHEKMGLAVGAGTAFIESRRRSRDVPLARQELQSIEETNYRSFGTQLAIDHRQQLLMMIEQGARRDVFLLAVILDDATETVDDLLWLQDLIERFPFLRVHLLVNTAQVSINFSSHMLRQVLEHECFTVLRESFGLGFQVTSIYCPFISFQTNYLPREAREVIDDADAVYVKGANFFETCQLPDCDVFHGFVVFGGVSRAYTGLADFESVFAYVPAGAAGYGHRPACASPVTLLDVVTADSTYNLGRRHNYG